MNFGNRLGARVRSALIRRQYRLALQCLVSSSSLCHARCCSAAAARPSRRWRCRTLCWRHGSRRRWSTTRRSGHGPSKSTQPGSASSDAWIQAARAIELARAVEGVADVVSELRVAVPPEPAAASPPESERSRARPSVETDDQNDSGPNLLAVGISVRRSMPADGTLDDALRLGPLIRLGSGRGWGPAIGFGWYGAEWYEGGPGRVPLGRLHRLAGMATVASLT